jgi:hypothetical protein
VKGRWSGTARRDRNAAGTGDESSQGEAFMGLDLDLDLDLDVSVVYDVYQSAKRHARPRLSFMLAATEPADNTSRSHA